MLLRTVLSTFLCFIVTIKGEETSDSGKRAANEVFVVEGKASVPGVKPSEWVPLTRLLIDRAEFQGFLK